MKDWIDWGVAGQNITGATNNVPERIETAFQENTMIRKIVIPLLAVAGLALAIYTVRASAQVRVPNPPVAEPAKSPFAYSVAGSGIIESSSENIAAGTPIAGVIQKVHVKPGDLVKKGDALFEIDNRQLTADLAVREATLNQFKSKLSRLQMSPRAEEVPPIEARLVAAEAAMTDAKNQLGLLEAITDQRAVIREDLTRRRDAVRTADARVVEAKAMLTLINSGAWAPDIAIAQADVAQAAAQVASVRTDLERLVVRAPIDGQILQRSARVGEFAQAGPATSNPLIMVGNTDTLHIRCDIDENDAWRLRSGAKARASLRGNGDIATDVTFVRIEPFVIPKRSLTGESTERVDTRVLQILFSFPKDAMNAYVGQLVDVRIEAEPNQGAGGSRTKG